MNTLKTLTALKEIHACRKKIANLRLQQGQRELQAFEAQYDAIGFAIGAADQAYDSATIGLLQAARVASQFRSLPSDLAHERVRYRQRRTMLDIQKRQWQEDILRAELAVSHAQKRHRKAAIGLERTDLLWTEEQRAARTAGENREEDSALELRSAVTERKNV